MVHKLLNMAASKQQRSMQLSLYLGCFSDMLSIHFRCSAFVSNFFCIDRQLFNEQIVIQKQLKAKNLVLAPKTFFHPSRLHTNNVAFDFSFLFVFLFTNLRIDAFGVLVIVAQSKSSVSKNASLCESPPASCTTIVLGVERKMCGCNLRNTLHASNANCSFGSPPGGLKSRPTHANKRSFLSDTSTYRQSAT